MNAKDWIKFIVEGYTPHGWETTRGVYANFSRWPQYVEYYVKCPKCGLVHGDFKSLKDAMARKLCDYCNFNVINKLKDEIEKVVDDPEHKPKQMTKLVGEAEEFNPFDSPAPRPPHPSSGVPEPDEDDVPDVKGEISRMLVGNWVQVALRDLAEDTGYDLTNLIIDVKWSEQNGNYDAENMEDTTLFKVDVGRHSEFIVFKDSEVLDDYAFKLVRQDLEDQPEVFTRSWLESFINMETLSSAIGDPYEDWEYENVGNLSYEELLQKMVEENCIEADDSRFFKKNGDPKVENPVRVKALDAVKDSYVEQNKPTLDDPMDWLRDIYGKEDATMEAIRIAGFDVDAAAKSAIETDGAAHFVARYNGHLNDLENGACYCRIN